VVYGKEAGGLTVLWRLNDRSVGLQNHWADVLGDGVVQLRDGVCLGQVRFGLLEGLPHSPFWLGGADGAGFQDLRRGIVRARRGDSEQTQYGAIFRTSAPFAHLTQWTNY